MSEIDQLTDLFHRRWTVPILLSIRANKGRKYITLVKTLGASPGATRTTLRELIKRGWIMKNPGYGHPMRPEYILTTNGKVVADRCDTLMQSLERAGLYELHRSKWATAILYCLGDKEHRFSELSSRLPKITDRSLTICLKSLCKVGAAMRTVEATFPPTVAYSLGEIAQGFQEDISALTSVL